MECYVDVMFADVKLIGVVMNQQSRGRLSHSTVNRDMISTIVYHHHNMNPVYIRIYIIMYMYHSSYN